LVAPEILVMRRDKKGADRFGGTRAGSENVEPAQKQD
jgi:hypothetical protein